MSYKIAKRNAGAQYVSDILYKMIEYNGKYAHKELLIRMFIDLRLLPEKAKDVIRQLEDIGLVYVNEGKYYCLINEEEFKKSEELEPMPKVRLTKKQRKEKEEEEIKDNTQYIKDLDPEIKEVVNNPEKFTNPKKYEEEQIEKKLKNQVKK